MNKLEKIDDWLFYHIKVYRILYRFYYHKIKQPARRLKFVFQKIFRGWSEDETWDLSYSIAKRFIKPLKYFKEVNNGYPNSLTWEEWNIIIDKIIYAFEKIVEDEPLNIIGEENEKVQEGCELFGEYFRHLWW